MTNSADQEKPTDLDLHYLQWQVIRIQQDKG